MRDGRVDLLRFIGLIAIIFAHSGPPGFLFQARNFDVPMMVLVSAMSFVLSYRLEESYGLYVWKRIKRLVFPVWVFLTGYFLFDFLVPPIGASFTRPEIIGSFFLQDGIGYVWVIRVFLMVAVLAPFLFVLHKLMGRALVFWGGVLALVCLYEVVRFFGLIYFGKDGILDLYFLHGFGYAIVFIIGLRMYSMSRCELLLMTSGALLVFLVASALLFIKEGRFVPTQEFKYPPSVYYFAYAIVASGVIWVSSSYLESVTKKLKVERLISFISANSIWIYLWHIPVVEHVQAPFIMKYMLTLGLSCSVTFLQVTILNRFILPNVGGEKIRKWVRQLLTG